MGTCHMRVTTHRHPSEGSLQHRESTWRTLSVSVGVVSQLIENNASRRSDADVGEGLFRAADEALYRTKRHGRRRYSSFLQVLKLKPSSPCDVVQVTIAPEIDVPLDERGRRIEAIVE